LAEDVNGTALDAPTTNPYLDDVDNRSLWTLGDVTVDVDTHPLAFAGMDGTSPPCKNASETCDSCCVPKELLSPDQLATAMTAPAASDLVPPTLLLASILPNGGLQQLQAKQKDGVKLQQLGVNLWGDDKAERVFSQIAHDFDDYAADATGVPVEQNT